MYPRELVLDTDTTDKLKSFLNEELFIHYGERSKMLDDLKQMQASYWAEPAEDRVTFPFQDASKLVIPLNAIAVEAIHARSMTTLWGLKQFISATATSADWVHATRPFERFMEHYLKYDLKAKDIFDNLALENEKFGTCIGKAGYERIVKYAIRENPDGSEEEFPVVISDGAVIDAVPIGRFLMRFSEKDPQKAEWCGEEHSETPYQVRQLEESGFFPKGTFDGLAAWVSTMQSTFNANEMEQKQAELENRQLTFPDRLTWAEIWLAFNIDGNEKGKKHEIVVHYHKDSQTLLSIRYNWHKDLRRPYRKGVYFPLEHRWYGIGIIKQNSQFQEEITTMHRQQLDNATLANMRMIKISRLSGYGPNEPIFPGKMWILDDMTHMEAVQMAEVYPSSYNSEQSTLIYSQMRLGVNELNQGMQQAGTPGTATSDLTRVQEGNKKFGYTFSNFKSFADEITLDLACEIQQFGPKNLDFIQQMEGGEYVRQLFQFPETFIRNGAFLEFKTAGQLENKLLDRQNLAQMVQQYNIFAQGRIQIAQTLMQISRDPKLFLQTLQAVYQGSGELMEQFFEAFDMRNVNRIINGTQGSQNGQPAQGGLVNTNGVPPIGDLTPLLTESTGGNG